MKAAEESEACSGLGPAELMKKQIAQCLQSDTSYLEDWQTLRNVAREAHRGKSLGHGKHLDLIAKDLFD